MKIGFWKKKKKRSELTELSRKQLEAAKVPMVERPGRSTLEEPGKPDAYYEKLADRARVLRYIVTAFLLLFAVGMAFFYSSEITAENFGLLLRNVSFSFPGENKTFGTVRYDADSVMDFAAYKQYFAAATSSALRLYDHRGNIVLDEKLNMKDPQIETGENYVMVYDREGKDYLVCNSVAVLKEESFERAIYSADMSDRGNYLLLSSSAQYLSIIKVYNRSFNLTKELKIDRYPLHATLSEEADRMMFLSYRTADSGALEGHVSFYDFTEKTELVADCVYNQIPLMGRMTGEGAAVVFEDRVVLYDLKGREARTVSFEERSPVRCVFSDEYLFCAVDENKVLAKSLLFAVNLSNGERVFQKEFIGRIERIWAEGGMFAVGEKQLLHIYSAQTGEEQVLKISLPEMLVKGDEKALFACYGNKAENIYEQIKIKESKKEQLQ